jgi:uncharacterized damage-inducible protein DinB
MKNEISQTFKLNTMLLNGMLEKMNEDDTLAKTGNSNTVGWIVGHIIKSRGSALKLFQKGYKELENEQNYARGAEKDGSAKIHPQNALIEFQKRGVEIETALMEAAEQQLQHKIDYKLPGVGDTVADALLFIAWHESFHVGQIDLILTALGKGGIK